MRKAIRTVRASIGMLLLTIGAIFVLFAVYVGGGTMSSALLAAVEGLAERRK